MKRVQWIVLAVTLYAIFFQLTPFLNISEGVIWIMFFLSPFLVAWMGYNILKHARPSQHSFDEYFYDDWDYKRNGKEELGSE
jgi:hypothetical protein